MTANNTSPTQVTTLPNGLTILTREVHGAPVATFWVWYRVGARNETPGLTGISHWVEHMVFKATPKLAAGEIFRLVNKHGGALNGFTSLDYTTYFETLPAGRLELAIEIEADRMANAIFDPEEVSSERTVIISEKQGGENHPTTHLRETTLAAAFRIHPYRQGVIGYLSDLQAITRDDLYHHYRTFYQPGNATVVAVGDFTAGEMTARIAGAFGAIPGGAPPPPLRVVEPEQEGERRVIVRRPGALPHFLAVYHAPAISHPDAFPLLVLDTILSGAGALGFGGGASLGRSSRFYRAFVETELASSASSSFGLMRDPYVFSISAGLRPNVTLEAVERVAMDQVERARSEPPAEEELARALKGLRAQFAYASEEVTSIAYWLGMLETIHSHTLYDEFLDRLAAVTPADVQRVAQRYLTADNRTVGHFIPSGEGGATTSERDDGAIQSFGVERAIERRWLSDSGASGGSPHQPLPSRPATAPATSHVAITRALLPNGIVVLGCERPESASVVVRARLRGGAIFDTGETAGLARLVAVMLQRGTEHHSFSELNNITDTLGASITAEPGRQVVGLRVRCLAEDFERLIGLLATIIRHPNFPEAELSKVRGQTLTTILQGDQDTRTVAERALRRLTYPAGHPYSRTILGTRESVEGISRNMIVDFHQRQYSADHLALAVVGGVSFTRAIDTLSRAFGDWPATGSPPALAVPDAGLPAPARREEITLAGKRQSDIALGHPSLSRQHPDYYALHMANVILGQFGLAGRLGQRVRQEQGLAYSVGSGLEESFGPGIWAARAGVNPANVERAIASMLSETRRLQDEVVEAGELLDAQDYLTGSLPLALESHDGVARIALEIDLYDLGLDYLDRYPAIIRALTREEVQEAARRHLHPDRAAVVVAGPEPPAQAE